MPLSVQDCCPGAVVQECYDMKGKQLPVRRNGMIIAVNYPNEDNHYESGNVKSVMVRFEEEKTPIEKQLRVLNLIRSSNSFAQAQLKQEKMNEQAELVTGGFDVPVVSDKTGLDPRRKYGPNDPEVKGKK